MRRPQRGRPGFRMRHLNQSGQFASGNPRYYYKGHVKYGGQAIAMPDAPPDSPEFRAAYTAAEEMPLPRITRAKAGTLGEKMERYLASDDFLNGLRSSTRGNRRPILSDIGEKYGYVPFRKIETQHIKFDLTKFDPHPANNRLRAWKGFYKWADATGEIAVDPARHIRKRATPESDGHTPWARPDFDQFREYWSLEPPQRLAFEVFYRSLASVVDALKFSPASATEGWLVYQRQKPQRKRRARKTVGVAVIPWSRQNAPEWFEWSDDLEAAHAAQNERHLTYIVTKFGKPRSIKATSQWFSAACSDAGLPDLSAHGIRKGRAATLKENGATTEQRMAIEGHETEEEASFYSRSADLRRVISGTKVPTQSGKLEILANKRKEFK